MEFVSPVVSCVEKVANPILKHVKYPFKAGENTTALESAIADLRARKADVNTVITDAQRDNGVSTEEAKRWLDKVTAIEEAAEKIQQEYRQLPRCLCNICPNVWSIYKTSKMAANKFVEVNSLSEKKPESIVHLPPPPPPPLAHEMPASSSISPNLRTALDCVNDNKNSIIGIWGMGGVGKTHLLKQINNELSRNPAFQVIVFVTCSKEYSEEKVQNEIIDRLRLDKNGSLEQKQSTIYNFFKERSFVLLLDDLWVRVDLDKIGIPDPTSAAGTCKRKVVLTTRSTEVCGQMEVKKRIRVDVLNWDGAWSLFKEKVTEETINSDPLIEECSKAVVKELGGLPLALITVGRAMYDKMDHCEWEDALEKLKQARLNDVEFSNTDQSVFHRLKFSYDSLKHDALKQCFLHCSLWPEDHPIPKNDLVELWMGLGLINESEIQAAYNVGYSYIRRLQAACLLEIDHDYLFNETIQMHDVIRDMALWMANNQGIDPKKWIVQAGTYNKHDSRTLRVELFSKLTFLNLYNNRFQVFPVEICKLVYLEYLNLSDTYTLESLPEELANLTNLKYLLLRGIQCTFPNRVLSKLKALRVLDLSQHSSADHVEIFPTVEEDLQCLPNFQALGITICSIPVLEKLAQTVSVPVRWLDVCYFEGKCLSFSSWFLGTSQLQSNLFSLQIRASDSVEYVEFESASNHGSICPLGRLEQLCFDLLNMNEIKWKNLDPKDVFPRLQTLEFNYCRRLTSISWVVNLPRIRELSVTGCDNMKQLICIDELTNSGVLASQHSFPFLNIMRLYFDIELERISDPMITFPALEIFHTIGCGKLKKLPFKTSDPPKKLKIISGPKTWWNNLEMENDSHRFLLRPFFKR